MWYGHEWVKSFKPAKAAMHLNVLTIFLISFLSEHILEIFEGEILIET